MDQPVPKTALARVLLPGFEIDLARDEVRTADGAHVTLRPRAYAVLRLLASNLGGLVSKDEIISRVWDDVVVTEDSLTQCIADIRRALHDEERKIIRTVPRRGYVLIGDEIPRTSKSAIDGTPAEAQAGISMPETHYAKSGTLHIAYQVMGDGPLDLVFVQGYVSHLELELEDPRPAGFYKRLASFSRLIRFDKRGTGLSDRLAPLPALEERMDDVRAVMDAVGSRKAVLLGSSEGGPMSMLFCATYPERVSALVLYGSTAKFAWAPDNSWGTPSEKHLLGLRWMEEKWGQGHSVDWFAPSIAANPEYRRWRGRVDRSGATPGAAVALAQMNYEIDVRHILPMITAPTLVIHREEERVLNVAHGRYIASRIPKAKLVELPGRDHAPWVGDTEAICKEIENFVTSVRQTSERDSVLSTILTVERADQGVNGDLGERASQYQSLAAQSIQLYRGSVVELTNRGFVAAFDGPARAVRCGRAMIESAKPLAIQLRAGVHTGECDVHGDRLSGMAVSTSRSIAAIAASGEVLVSSTVRDVVAGSGLCFESRGIQKLADISATCTLLAAI